MSYIEFMRKESAKRRSISTGSVLLDRAFGIPLEAFLMLRGDMSAGKTAIALQVASSFLAKDPKHTVVYIDIKDSIYTHRLLDLTGGRLVIAKPQTPNEIIGLANVMLDNGFLPMVILDSVTLLDEFRNQPDNYDAFARNLKSVGAVSIVSLAPTKHKSRDIWAYVVDITIHQTKYVESQPVGHEVSVVGPLGKTVHYIEYQSGRLLPAYEHAKLEIEKGKSPSDIFELNGVKTRGFWNFVLRSSEHQNELSS